MADIQVINQRRFFQNIQLDDDGALKVEFVIAQLPVQKEGSQYKVFQKMVLTKEGFLKVIE